MLLINPRTGNSLAAMGSIRVEVESRQRQRDKRPEGSQPAGSACTPCGFPPLLTPLGREVRSFSPGLYSAPYSDPKSSQVFLSKSFRDTGALCGLESITHGKTEIDRIALIFDEIVGRDRANRPIVEMPVIAKGQTQ